LIRTTCAVVVATALALAASVAAAGTPPNPEPYDPGSALGLSIGFTAAGVGLVAVGAEVKSPAVVLIGAGVTYLGPSTGHWYAQHYFTGGLLVRTLSVVLVLVGAASCSDKPSCDGGNAVVVLGLAAYAGGALGDILTAPGEARRRNAELVNDLAITPTLAPHAAGLAISGRF
jgi:hypothetical protein